MNDLAEFVRQNWLWLGAASALSALISSVVALAAYRESKTGFFLLVRKTATLRAQRAGLLALSLLLLSLAFGAVPRLTGMPPPGALAPGPNPTRTRLAAGSPWPGATLPSVLEPTLAAPGGASTGVPAVEATLAPTATLRPEGPITSLVFSRGITGDNRPREPAQVFKAGEEIVYTFFTFEGMSDGQAWSQVWTQEGKEIKRKAEPWHWGAQGSAYVYFKPPGGYTPGTYQVQLFVGDKLVASGQFIVQ